MQVKGFSEAKTYEAPHHRDFTRSRLFGTAAGGPKKLIVGISHFQPRGGAGPDASPPQKANARWPTILLAIKTEKGTP
jgi:hypothetical protein